MFPILTINNTSGANPAVLLNQSFALQTGLNLYNGILGGTGTLTEGQAISGSTFNMNRTLGSMTMANAFNLTGLTFNANYGNGTTIANITTGPEIPYASTANIYGDFTVNNPMSGTLGGITLGGNIGLTYNGNGLTMTSGNITLAGYNLALSSVTGLNGNGNSVTNMIVADGLGQLIKGFPATTSGSSFTYPIGDNSGGSKVINNTGPDYSPLAITMNSNSDVRNIGLNVMDDQNPNDNSANNYISRYWNFTDNLLGAGSYNYTATFTYSNTYPGDLVGTQAS